MLDFVTYTGVDTSSQKLVDITANLSGDLFDLPAGALGFAVGVEHREEDGNFIPDPGRRERRDGGRADQPDGGRLYRRRVLRRGDRADPEGPARVRLPVAERSCALLGFGLCSKARPAPSSAVNWGPTENLMLRASYAEGFRAPNIGELFNLGSRFDSGITDQCNTAVNPVQPANCAALGVPDDYVQLNPQVSVDTGGNPDLQPETSETFTAGFTWDIPLSGAFERLLFEANYYDITIDGAIQAPDAQDVLDACIATLDPLFCGQVNRIPSGTITSIEGTLNNIGGIETNGFDLNLDLSLG